jgi:hypothetical protein
MTQQELGFRTLQAKQRPSSGFGIIRFQAIQFHCNGGVRCIILQINITEKIYCLVLYSRMGG